MTACNGIKAYAFVRLLLVTVVIDLQELFNPCHVVF